MYSFSIVHKRRARHAAAPNYSEARSHDCCHILRLSAFRDHRDRRKGRNKKNKTAKVRKGIITKHEIKKALNVYAFQRGPRTPLGIEVALSVALRAKPGTRQCARASRAHVRSERACLQRKECRFSQTGYFVPQMRR